MSVVSVSRRRVLKTASFLGAGAVASAQQRIPVPGPPPRERGPKVFLDYDQIELDAAYDQNAYAFNSQQVVAREANNSDLARKRLGEAAFDRSATNRVLMTHRC